MALDAGGNYVDENSDYSFLCEYCKYWYQDIDTQGRHVPEIPADLCHDCLEEYKKELCPAQLIGSSLDDTDYDAMAKDNMLDEQEQEFKVTGEYR